MTDLGHYWVYDRDEEMSICGGCDCYRGSRASLRPCSAYTPPSRAHLHETTGEDE